MVRSHLKNLANERHDPIDIEKFQCQRNFVENRNKKKIKKLFLTV